MSITYALRVPSPLRNGFPNFGTWLLHHLSRIILWMACVESVCANGIWLQDWVISVVLFSRPEMTA